jgi:3-oxoacyl-ACP reductase-like protein
MFMNEVSKPIYINQKKTKNESRVYKRLNQMIAAATTAAASTTAAAASATASAAASAVVTVSGIPIDFAHAGLVATVFLIAILIVKELITADQKIHIRLKDVVHGLDMSLASLLPVFFVIVGFKILTVVG